MQLAGQKAASIAKDTSLSKHKIGVLPLIDFIVATNIDVMAGRQNIGRAA